VFEVRVRVAIAFAEKAHELADAIGVVSGLSKDTSRLFVAAIAFWAFAKRCCCFFRCLCIFVATEQLHAFAACCLVRVRLLQEIHTQCA
jgi:hypothetical protein